MPINFSLIIILATAVILSIGYLQPRVLSQAIRVVCGKTIQLSYTNRLSVVLWWLASALVIFLIVPGIASLGSIVAKFFILRYYIPNRDNDIMFVVAADVAIGIAIWLWVLALVGLYMFVWVQLWVIDQAWIMQQLRSLNTL